MEINQIQGEINQGSIVSYEGGFYRVTRCTKNTVNLGSVWGGKVYHKGIAKSEVTEASESFYEYWQKSESYMCM